MVFLPRGEFRLKPATYVFFSEPLCIPRRPHRLQNIILQTNYSVALAFFLHVSPYSSLPYFLKAIIMGFEEDKLVTNVF